MAAAGGGGNGGDKGNRAGRGGTTIAKTGGKCVVFSKFVSRPCTRIAATSARWVRRPLPGHPLAKDVNSRCITTTYSTQPHSQSKRPKVGFFDPTFGGYEAEGYRVAVQSRSREIGRSRSVWRVCYSRGSSRSLRRWRAGRR